MTVFQNVQSFYHVTRSPRHYAMKACDGRQVNIFRSGQFSVTTPESGTLLDPFWGAVSTDTRKKTTKCLMREASRLTF
jgi:hypothetical protein